MHTQYYRSSPPQAFLGKDILKICSKFTGEQPYQSAISIKLLCNFKNLSLRLFHIVWLSLYLKAVADLGLSSSCKKHTLRNTVDVSERYYIAKNWWSTYDKFSISYKYNPPVWRVSQPKCLLYFEILSDVSYIICSKTCLMKNSYHANTNQGICM